MSIYVKGRSLSILVAFTFLGKIQVFDSVKNKLRKQKL